MFAVITIWFKEILDTLRDRRTLYAMIIAPMVVMPIFSILPQRLVARQLERRREEMVRLVIIGAEHAPKLVSFLRESGQVEIVPVPQDVQAALREGEIAVALEVGSGFEGDLEAQRPTRVRILSDESKMASGVAASRIGSLLESYSKQIVAQRLAESGIDPRILTPFEVELQNVASEREMGGTFMAMMIPLAIAIWAVVGGMYTAIDVTAGEKERKTLEPLLTVPLSRLQLVSGKLAAVVTTSLVAVALSMISMFVALRLFPVPSDWVTGETVAVQLPISSAVLILLEALPLILFMSAVEMAICIFARSFKEAQNYIVPLQFAVMIPTLTLGMIPDLSLPRAARIAPIVGPILSFRDILMGAADGPTLLLTALSSLVYAAVAVLLAVYTFSRERAFLRV
jgi:sodium transport system permease protein